MTKKKRGRPATKVLGPFPPKMIRHFVELSPKDMEDNELLPVELLMSWINGNGFIPDSIEFSKETKDFGHIVNYTVTIITRYVGGWSEWKDYMKDSSKVVYQSPTQ